MSACDARTHPASPCRPSMSWPPNACCCRSATCGRAECSCTRCSTSSTPSRKQAVTRLSACPPAARAPPCLLVPAAAAAAPRLSTRPTGCSPPPPPPPRLRRQGDSLLAQPQVLKVMLERIVKADYSFPATRQLRWASQSIKCSHSPKGSQQGRLPLGGPARRAAARHRHTPPALAASVQCPCTPTYHSPTHPPATSSTRTHANAALCLLCLLPQRRGA